MAASAGKNLTVNICLSTNMSLLVGQCVGGLVRLVPLGDRLSVSWIFNFE